MILTNCGFNCAPQCPDCLQTILLQLQAQSGVSVWFSEYQPRYSAAFSSGYQLTSLYQEALLANSITTDGSYLSFSYHLQTQNNSNTKDIYVKFTNVTLIHYQPNANRDVSIKGTIKAINCRTKTALYEITLKEYNSNASDVDLYYSGTITANFGAINKLILQGQGNNFGDVSAISGEGTLNILQSL